MRLKSAFVAVLLCHALVLPLFAQNDADADTDTAQSFSLTSQRTYLPGEKPEVSVYSHNVKALEFRVYRVNDPVKFFSQMQELHNFGGHAPALPKQAHTWLEKFHAWKHRIWAWIRDFVRAQFSAESRQKIRLWQMGGSEKKSGAKVESYAQVPVLNQQQVVSVWNWTVPAHDRWESQSVAIPVSEKGVYLVEATNGTLRAYTIIVVTEIAVITKAAPGRLMSFVVNRRTGDPIAGIMVRVWVDQKEVAAKTTDQQGLLDTKLTEAKPENVAVLATSADQFAINTPGAWSLGNDPDASLSAYTYTDRPVYRPGDTVHFKSIVRAQTMNGYVIPQSRDLRLEMRDPRDYKTIWQQTVKLSDMGTAEWNYVIPAEANLGTYYLSMQMGERYVEGTNFSVEDYKKPEYQVKVTAQTPRVLQGQPIKATIDARYYFGEPVANAKVTWVVHTSTYWPMGHDQDDEEAGADQEGDSAEADDPEGDDTDGGEQASENSGTLDADGKLQITIPTKVDSKKQDLTYRIEARVTDAGNREIAGHGFALATYGSFFLTAAAGLLRLHQGQHGDRHHHRARLRQEAGPDDVPRGDESLGLAQRRGPIGHYHAGPNRRQRQSADQAHHPRCRRVSRSRNRNHSGESHHRNHRIPMGSGRKSVVERSSAGAGADCRRQEDLSAGRYGARADRHQQGADFGPGDGRRQRTLLRPGDQEQRRQHHGGCSDQAGVRPELLRGGGFHSRQQAVSGIEESHRAARFSTS